MFCLAASNSGRSSSEASGPILAGSMFAGIFGGTIGSAITVTTNMTVRRPSLNKTRILQGQIRAVRFASRYLLREHKESRDGKGEGLICLALSPNPYPETRGP